MAHAKAKAKTKRRARNQAAPAVPPGSNLTLTSNDLELLVSAVATRAAMFGRHGKSFDDARDVYTAMGYTRNPTYNDYRDRYERQDIAGAIIDRPVEACWESAPIVSEIVEGRATDAEDTEFERAWNDIARNAELYHLFERVDKLAAIGHYAVLFLGFDGPQPLSQPVEQATTLAYAQVYDEVSAQIEKLDERWDSPRFGRPMSYRLDIGGNVGTRVVHWTRCIHVAEDVLTGQNVGTPQLRRVLNRLFDLDLVSGGTAEGYWRGGFPGVFINALEGFDLGKDAAKKQEFQDALEAMEHGFKRFMAAKGIEPKQLQQQISDPTQAGDFLIALISAATGIPKRILLGSERGELASSADERNWARVVRRRQRRHCEPVILRPTIKRLSDVGLLTAPEAGYVVKWPDPSAPSDKERADVAKTVAEALKAYGEASVTGGEERIPFSMFAEEYLGWTPDQAARADALVKAVRRYVDGSNAGAGGAAE